VRRERDSIKIKRTEDYESAAEALSQSNAMNALVKVGGCRAKPEGKGQKKKRRNATKIRNKAGERQENIPRNGSMLHRKKEGEAKCRKKKQPLATKLRGDSTPWETKQNQTETR